jgi:hypothetical protein
MAVPEILNGYRRRRFPLKSLGFTAKNADAVGSSYSREETVSQGDKVEIGQPERRPSRLQFDQ